MTTMTIAIGDTSNLVDVLCALRGNSGSQAGTSRMDSQMNHPLGVIGSKLIALAQAQDVRIETDKWNPVPFPVSGYVSWHKTEHSFKPWLIMIRGEYQKYPLYTLSVLAHELGHVETWEERFSALFTCSYFERYTEEFFELLKATELNAWKWAKEFLDREGVWAEEFEHLALEILRTHQIEVEMI